MCPIASLSTILDAPPGSVNPSVPTSSTVVFFSSHERKGTVAMGIAALTSCVLVSVLLLCIIASAAFSWRQPQLGSQIPFIKKDIALLIMCLLVADLIQSIAGVQQLQWARESKVYEGVICTAQGVMLTIGDLGSTVWSCVIASQTFSSIVLGRQWSRRAIYAIIIVGWSFVGMLTMIGPMVLETPSKGPFFGIAGGWCFITSSYPIQRLGIHYVPLFIAAIIILVFYGLVFLSMQGNISFLRDMQVADAVLRERVAIAKRMLWYPAAFLACISPIAIVRLVGIHNDNIPYSVWTFCVIVIFLLGAVDSIIYATTRTLINPIKNNSSPHMRISNLSPTHVDNDHYSYPPNMGANDISKIPNSDGQTLDISAYISRDGQCTHKDNPRRDEETQPSIFAVHVMLEQVREVV